MELRNRYSDYFLMLCVAGFILLILSIIAGAGINKLVILVPMLLIISTFFYRIPRRITIHNDEITIHWPVKSITLNKTNIEFIDVRGKNCDVMILNTNSGIFSIHPMHMDKSKLLIKWLEEFVKPDEENKDDSKSGEFKYRLSVNFLSSLGLMFLIVTIMLLLINVQLEYAARFLVPVSLLIGAIIFVTVTKKITLNENNIEISSPFIKKSISISALNEIWIDKRGVVTFVTNNWVTMSVGSLGTLYFTGFYDYLQDFSKKHSLSIRSMPVVTHGTRLFTLITILLICGIILGIFYTSIIGIPVITSVKKQAMGVELSKGIINRITDDEIDLKLVESDNIIVLDRKNIAAKNLKPGIKLKLVKLSYHLPVMNHITKNMMLKTGFHFSIIYLIPLLIIAYIMVNLPKEKGKTLLRYYALVDKLQINEMFNDLKITHSSKRNFSIEEAILEFEIKLEKINSQQ